MAASKVSAVSAPGKVLLAGGYLVLDRAYTGLVFGLSARIHVVVQAAASDAFSEIIVRSPQFKEAEWRYSYLDETGTQGSNVKVQQFSSSAPQTSRNPFVETALTFALAYVQATVGIDAIQPAVIDIFADRDYYSAGNHVPPTTSVSGYNFVDFGVKLQDAHKTGLGSSAALVTAFTGAVLSHYLPKSQLDITSTGGQTLLHNLAQAAHCAAQGKVGSGFDVAVAVYGSCIYRRFSPSIVERIGSPDQPDFASRLKAIVEDPKLEEWDTEVLRDQLQIPKGMALVMCDVDCGSQTVGMVKKVLEWRSRERDSSTTLWDNLQAKNDNLATALQRGVPGQITEAIAEIRAMIRRMGEASGVPIEPPEQTALLDAVTEGVEGVYGGVVPGAGGYDAVVLVVRGDEDTLGKLRSFLREWSSANGTNVNLLDVKGEMQGARYEKQDAYHLFL